MRLFRICLALFFTISSVNIHAQTIDIGLFHAYSIKSVIITVVKGKFHLQSPSYEKQLYAGEACYLTIESGYLSLQNNNGQKKTVKKMVLTGFNTENIISIKPLSTKINSKLCTGTILISALLNEIRIINTMNLTDYLAGVVESEGGSGAEMEYYKAQAVIARTYAMKNAFRHSGDGFNLCDGAHCQAFYGISLLNNDIYKAVAATDNLVITDKAGNLLTTPYHSNCGGMTADAADVWQNHLPHLKAVHDPFCISSKNASWSKVIDFNEWVAYLQKQNFNLSQNIDVRLLRFNQSDRMKDYSLNYGKVSFKQIRQDFSLKSAFFNVNTDGVNIVLEGKGFGHGVGLCQEGAMEMAKAGYSFKDIIHFYYQNINIQPYNSILKEKGNQ